VVACDTPNASNVTDLNANGTGGNGTGGNATPIAANGTTAADIGDSTSGNSSDSNASAANASSIGRRLGEVDCVNNDQRSSWNGVAAGGVKWLYSDARQAYEGSAVADLARLLRMPQRRIVVQGTTVDADAGLVTLYAWVLDLEGDPSSDTRPAINVQAWLHEWFEVCERREGGAPPAPPPPPPSEPPLRPPPTLYPEGQGPNGRLAGSGSLAYGALWGGRGEDDDAPQPQPQPLLSITGEPSGEHEHSGWACPLRLLNSTITEATDATPPSPPASPPPPPPPSPPSPPPSPPYIECYFVPCEVLSDEEVERLEREAIAMYAVSSAARAATRSMPCTVLLASVVAWTLRARSRVTVRNSRH